MDERSVLFERLIELPNSLFEIVLFRFKETRLGVRQSGTLGQQAIDLIEELEQREGLEVLSNFLDDLMVWNEYLPEGAYPIDERLLKREEEYVIKGNPHVENPLDQIVTPEAFYTFHKETAWIGVFREWDAERSFYKQFKESLVNQIGSSSFPSAAIIGQGASGKSVIIRRLGIDLSRAGYTVWWVSDPKHFINAGLHQLLNATREPFFLLIDEIHWLNDEELRRLIQSLQQKSIATLVVAGRNLPRIHIERLQSEELLFDLGRATDQHRILNKMIELLPAWADVIKQIPRKLVRGTRLLHLLVIIARQKALPREANQLEALFLDTVGEEYRSILNQSPGLAEAFLIAACSSEVDWHLSRRTFLALAEQKQPGISNLLSDIDENSHWNVIRPFVDIKTNNPWVRFHHTERAKSFLEAGKRGYLSGVNTNNPWRRAAFEQVITLEQGSHESRSLAFSTLVEFHPKAISEEKYIDYFKRLLISDNTHQAYLSTILDQSYKLPASERLKLLLHDKMVGAISSNPTLVAKLWDWVEENYSKQKERLEIVRAFYDAGYRTVELLNYLIKNTSLELIRNTLIQDLEKLVAQKKDWKTKLQGIKRLGNNATKEILLPFLDPKTHPEIQILCLKLLSNARGDLGHDADDKAMALLEKTQDTSVQILCLKFLGEKAEQKALDLLESIAVNFQVKTCCLKLLSNARGDLGREVDGKARALLEQYIVALQSVEEKWPEGSLQGATVLGSQSDPQLILEIVKRLGSNANEKYVQLLRKGAFPKVLKAILDLLEGDEKYESEAVLFAAAQVRNWRELEPYLVVRMLRTARLTPEAHQVANEIMTQWTDVYKDLLVAALRIPHDTPLRVQRAFEVLRNWELKPRELVSGALTAFWNDAEVVKMICMAIVMRWKKEVIKSRREKHIGHIIKALANPNPELRKHSLRAVEDMLEYESKKPGFLPPILKEWAINIATSDEWPIWSSFYDSDS